jgi:hypothetical protein
MVYSSDVSWELLSALDELDRQLKETETGAKQASFVDGKTADRPEQTDVQVHAAYIVTSPTTPSLASATTQLLAIKHIQDAFALTAEMDQLKKQIAALKMEEEDIKRALAEQKALDSIPKMAGFTLPAELDVALLEQAERRRAALGELEQLKTAGPTQIVQEDLSRGAVERRQAFDQPRK